MILIYIYIYNNLYIYVREKMNIEMNYMMKKDRQKENEFCSGYCIII